ncbi:calcineurin-like phosphoesterase C-terminal domain-containing protein [Algibacter miyuki]|uniref:Calcineurin-like phosphoesterase C-terminal domain-containing protein n=1 Tax=Algibacter miyuki TaxID=1306933 RepID=A0ABV5GY93_9FLAO|nr:calcineurin-like phosphoesterase family protein [Algibacter miyuki]MDN3667194.1 calcineurin-like phosphoesterase family protein [Algibacter miyuki]
MTTTFKIIVFYCCLSISFSSYAQAINTWVSGTVSIQNKSSHKGLKNMMVSNGDTIVTTNKKGVFKIPVKKGQVVFPILSSGYGYANTKKWWYNIPSDFESTSDLKIDFQLQKIQKNKAFKFLAIGDIQVGDNTELLQATQSVLKELLNRNDYDFSIYLGDLVNDAPDLFMPLKKLVDDVKQPSWVVYGNHDRNFKTDKENQPNLFRDNFGPDTYAFFRNDVLFVALNSIKPEGKYGYKGIYKKNQIDFLSQLLATVDANQPIVISQHIPFVGMKNKKELIEILNPFKNVLFLTGHTHTAFRNTIKMPSGNMIHELTAGAVCGNWWTGQKDWEGIPLALMSCGTPKGYFEIDFNKADYKIKYKGINLPSNKQFSVWFGDYNGEPLSSLAESNAFYVNVFSGSSDTKVSVVLPNKKVVFLKKEAILDPFVNYIKQTQKEGLTPDKNSKKSAYLRTKSRHIWKGVMPDELEKGYHKVEIKIEDPYFSTIKDFLWVLKE